MQTADNVARWLLNSNAARALGGEPDIISNLKLQKLLYYAQGLSLALREIPLFKEPILAWPYGPVVESVYDTYKCNKANGIENFNPPEDNFTADETAVLQFTQDTFGQFSAWKLADMTHEETPWQSTPLGEEITTDKILKYFKANYVEETP